MYFGYSWDVFAIKAANPNLSFTIHPVPNIPGRKGTIASYWVNGISTKSTHQKEALLLMQYLAQKNVQQKLFNDASKTRLFGTPYARKDLAATVIDNPLLAPFLQQADYAQSSYFSSDTKDTSYTDKLNEYLANAIQSVLNRGSAKSAVDGLTAGIQQVRTQYNLQ
jgi:ABC-type glycerol-3-phosphate transport system substrate-binding protein